MKNGRLFEILYLLVEKRAVTAREMAQRLEVAVGQRSGRPLPW